MGLLDEVLGQAAQGGNSPLMSALNALVVGAPGASHPPLALPKAPTAMLPTAGLQAASMACSKSSRMPVMATP